MTDELPIIHSSGATGEASPFPCKEIMENRDDLLFYCSLLESMPEAEAQAHVLRYRELRKKQLKVLKIFRFILTICALPLIALVVRDSLPDAPLLLRILLSFFLGALAIFIWWITNKLLEKKDRTR